MRLAEPTDKPHFASIVEAFRRHGVEFMVIGGQAEVLYGGGRVTIDCDFAYQRSDDNIKRLAAALAEMHPRLRGAPPGVTFKVDAGSLAAGNNFTLETDFGDLDILGFVEPFGDYEVFRGRAQSFTYLGQPLLVMSLDDLITIKQHIKRPKDQASLVELLALKRERDAGRS